LHHEIIDEVTCKRFAPGKFYFFEVRAPQKDLVYALVGEVGGAPLNAQRLQIRKLHGQKTERLGAKMQAFLHIESF